VTGAAPRAVVFAYSDVGVRCLSTLLAHRIEIPLVVSHRDNPAETIWFDSVAELAALNDIDVITPDNPNTADVVARLRQCRPDWIFSFYYRQMLAPALLDIPRNGAFNMHGSLLPRYRGRAPTNWAVLNGETETGASLHRMVSRADAGHLIDQQAVSILPNDSAHQVYRKVTLAAEMVMMRSLPLFLAGAIAETPQDLEQGSYFGGRKPEDGCVDPGWPTRRVHNMIRALAPPYPGAFFDIADVPGKVGSQRLIIEGSYYRGLPAERTGPRIYWQQGRCWFDGADGERLLVRGLRLNGEVLTEAGFRQLFGSALIPTGYVLNTAS